MVKSGISIVVILWVLALIFSVPHNSAARILGVLFFALGFFVIFFFRDPARIINKNSRILFSPADGEVMDVTSGEVEHFGKSKVVKIFLSVFDVHLQRSPAKLTVETVSRKDGLFKPAYDSEASALNTSNTIILKNDAIRIGVIQITGIIARRIECWVKPGQNVEQGEKIGFIKFGSQVDVILPENVDVTVKPKDKVRAGLTIIGTVK